ncbi:MAG: hypothetical protein H8D22_01915 [Candidatus Cloacimonetes bacterium]|nr:hypothetical protein [Candidatus Cloacimonadota bacterium]
MLLNNNNAIARSISTNVTDIFIHRVIQGTDLIEEPETIYIEINLQEVSNEKSI